MYVAELCCFSDLEVTVKKKLRGKKKDLPLPVVF